MQHPSTVLALRANPPSPTGGEGRALSGRTEGARRIAAAFILRSCIIRLKTFALDSHADTKKPGGCPPGSSSVKRC
ncbi:MAG: hypothetical protein EOS04_06970 [Mesorhizobium sp.]|nr:MAG: hypothetical protein EOR98_10435 [Mesorhizobium sp.]RWN76611.1 MAG: hypothetical protein EOS02_14125 [Mesorhizobium sp.]RWN81420.1 MAG: hypothetical protein EOS01_10430 [Mesorhizobium sp.]RWN90418.1 MAG: hypothetical protein EOS04_06970 [Mesorhizobium sp.]RWO15422.1 MAG: hypothetical protein EOS15_10445 [Mesorhizobium sp.]